MRVIRKGKVKEVKKIWVGDIYIGECWCCGQTCICESLANKSTRHSPLTDEAKDKLNFKE